MPNPLPWVDTLLIVRSLFLDPGKILCDQSRHELKGKYVHEVFNIY